MATVERTEWFDASPDDLWRALTEPELLCEWLASSVELEPRLGGRVQVVDDGGNERRGVVHTVDPARRIVFSWTPTEGDAPASTVEITLEPDGDGTTLRVTETVFAFERFGSVLGTEPRALARV